MQPSLSGFVRRHADIQRSLLHDEFRGYQGVDPEFDRSGINPLISSKFIMQETPLNVWDGRRTKPLA